MNKIKAFWNKILGLVTKSASVLERIHREALPIAEYIARLTPMRTDDEIIRLYKEFGVPFVEKWLALPPEDRGAALLNALTVKLRERFPDVPTTIIQLGAQAAVADRRENG